MSCFHTLVHTPTNEHTHVPIAYVIVLCAWGSAPKTACTTLAVVTPTWQLSPYVTHIRSAEEWNI